MFIINLKGTACRDLKFCLANDIIHKWSLYNLLSVNTATLPHMALWLAFAIAMIGFNFYLRTYVLKTFRRINDNNITDSDYCILLRRLPDLVSREEIKQLVDG